jgi:hypothetical protein
MTRFTNAFLAFLTAISFAAAPSVATARAKDHIDYGFCKSGKQVSHIKNCKENGGTK